jgi:hypothetical protein
VKEMEIKRDKQCPLRHLATQAKFSAPLNSRLSFANFFCLARCAMTNGGIGVPLVLAHYKEDVHVRCALPIDMVIA